MSFEQELAVWRIVEPLGFDASPKIVARELFSLSEDEAEVSNSSLLDWHHQLAFTLAQYIPRPIPKVPLRTFDLLRPDQPVLPSSFRPPEPAREVAEEV
jgi:hypothetical protein